MEEVCGLFSRYKVEHKEIFWNDDMNIKNLMKYFDRIDSSIRKTIKKIWQYQVKKVNASCKIYSIKEKVNCKNKI